MSVITAKRTVIKQTAKETWLRRQSLPELARKCFAKEASWEFFMGTLFFAVVVAISAWPIFAAADALNRFL